MGKVIEFKEPEALDEFELSHFKDLLEEQKKLEELGKALSAAWASHLSFVTKKYKLLEGDNVSVETGVITRKDKVDGQES